LKNSNLIKFTSTSLYLIVTFIHLQSQSNLKEIQLTLKQNILAQNKVLKAENRVYYNLLTGDLLTESIKPIQSFTSTNTKGEMKFYDPIKNTVMFSQSEGQSSEYSIFNVFFSYQKSDMNLKKLGFEIEKTEVDKDKNIVTTWKNMTSNKKVKKAKLVQEKFLPIFLAFYNEKNEAISKIYYSEYVKIDSYQLPLKMTEITITKHKKDSIIDRRIYSNLKINNEVDNNLKNYPIPENATILKSKK
jgi:hypothetical protein